MLPKFVKVFGEVAEANGERLLKTEGNDISFGMTLENFTNEECGDIGSMLFTRCLSGCRVVPTGVSKNIGGEEFRGFGSSTDDYGVCYLTAACAVGMKEREVNEFGKRLDSCLKEVVKKREKRERKKEKEKEKEKE